MTNTIVTINSDKKERYCYILHIVLSEIVLLLIISIICYHYARHRSKQKKITNSKVFVLKIVRVIILMA